MLVVEPTDFLEPAEVTKEAKQVNSLLKSGSRIHPGPNWSASDTKQWTEKNDTAQIHLNHSVKFLDPTFDSTAITQQLSYQSNPAGFFYWIIDSIILILILLCFWMSYLFQLRCKPM